MWERTGGEFSVQLRHQKALRCYVVAECLGSERAAEYARDMSKYLQSDGVTKAETDRMEAARADPRIEELLAKIEEKR